MVALQPQTVLGESEATHQTPGNAILRRVQQAAWDLLEAQVADWYCQGPCHIHAWRPLDVFVAGFRVWLRPRERFVYQTPSVPPTDLTAAPMRRSWGNRSSRPTG